MSNIAWLFMKHSLCLALERGYLRTTVFDKPPARNVLTNQTSPSNMSGKQVTWMSKLVWFLVKLSPVSTNQAFTEAKFKFFSLKTLIFCLGCYGPTVTLNIVGQVTGYTYEVTKHMTISKNKIDQGSMLATSVVAGCTVLFPFLVSSGIPAISMIALASDLRWPKYGLMVVVSTLLTITAQIFGKVPFRI